ncbi:Tyrosine--tRNA ligase (Tyrosyl-tRNA synthetase) (TyrRS) [Durusdinium trenchii]|uniref:Tyrosine--tRNA ligase n=1 Tax=Durusdinium trenchii TaxID=1381693 RepID=A0ABP0K377_9DINO
MKRVVAALEARGLVAGLTHGGSTRCEAAHVVGVDGVELVDEVAHAAGGQPRSVYLGVDPSADGLHVGHLLGVLTLRSFQRHGFRPIALVGGATGLIGDPSGRATERQMLSEEQVQANVRGIQSDLERLLDFDACEVTGSDTHARLVNNADWYKDMSALGFLRDVGKHFRVGAMKSRDSVKSRVDQGLSFTEFSYQILQGYDFLHLYRTMGCRVQVGGSDQWGNIVSGVDLIRRVTGKRDAYGLTIPLLVNSDGTKFGKSAGNAVWLRPDKTSHLEFYQFFLRLADAEVEPLLPKLCGDDLHGDDLAQLVSDHRADLSKRLAQTYLAEHMTALVRGATGLRRAQVATKVLFGASLDDLSAADLLDLGNGTAEVPVVELRRDDVVGKPLASLAVQAKLCKSSSEARRLIASGGLYINNARVAPTKSTTFDPALHAKEGELSVLRAGKRKHAIIHFPH